MSALGGVIGWRYGVRGVTIAVVAAVAVIWLLARLAPGPVNQRVTASTIPPSACGSFGRPASARLIDTAGPYPIYSVTCTSGIVTEWAGP